MSLIDLELRWSLELSWSLTFFGIIEFVIVGDFFESVESIQGFFSVVPSFLQTLDFVLLGLSFTTTYVE